MMSFGAHPERPWALPEADSEPIIRRAVEGGITFFDTADVYNGGESEVVGERLTSRAGSDSFADSLYVPEVDFAVVDHASKPERFSLAFVACTCRTTVVRPVQPWTRACTRSAML